MNYPKEIDSTEKKFIDYIDEISLSLGRSLPGVAAALQMEIIIPAKDEEEHISPTLKNLAKLYQEFSQTNTEVNLEVLILCHNCSDLTFLKCKEFSGQHPTFPLQILVLNDQKINTVGAARRILMNIAAARLSTHNSLIITTDADTVPEKKWLFQLEKYINSDTDMICGFIKSNSTSLQGQALHYLRAKDEYLKLKTRLECLLFPNENDPWPRHSYHWGPNLAIKKYAYQAIGGIRPLHFLEDVDLYKRVIAEGFSTRHCLKTRVTTSVRINSRCSEGFGAELKVWSEQKGVAYKVESLEKLFVRFQIYSLIKKLYLSPSDNVFSQISRLSLMDENQIKKLYSEEEKFPAMLMKMENYLDQNELWNSTYPNIEVKKANNAIRFYLSLLISR